MVVRVALDSSPHGDFVSWTHDLGLEFLAGWLDAHPVGGTIYGLVAALTTSLIALLLVRKVLLRLVTNVIGRTAARWDDLLIEKKVLVRLSWAVPWLVFDALAPRVPDLSLEVLDAIDRVSGCALVWVSLRAWAALLVTVDAVYNGFPAARNRPIKGYLQIVVIGSWLFGVVMMAAILLDRSPWLLLSGLGALTAVFLLVFRDTLLSLVAGVQLTTNDLIRVGDWIELPQFGADGSVVDLALHAVKVQNWDNTFTTIPTHAFLEHSFRNWRGMSESGGRRIKRAINLDIGSIHFLDGADLERFERFSLLSDYIASKRAELDAYNAAHAGEGGELANERRLTNVGTLRAYAVAYLRQHPGVRTDFTLMVRQLAPTAQGLPLEIYAFARDIKWENYEALQADIVDHLLAIIPKFGLRVFQAPGGADFAALADRERALGAAAVQPGG